MKKNKTIDVVSIRTQVKENKLKFYIQNKYIYCENTMTKERVIVGEYETKINIDINTNPTKMFETLATIDAGSFSRTKGQL